MKDSVRNHFIAPFETTDQIISVLRAQFAGLLQNLLQREASMTEAKTAYDLQQSADSMKAILADFVQEKEEGIVFVYHLILCWVQHIIGI